MMSSHQTIRGAGWTLLSSVDGFDMALLRLDADDQKQSFALPTDPISAE
jgi:hypothetical protein